MNHKLRIKTAGKNNNNIRYADNTLMAEKEEELKSFLMRVKEVSRKAGLKLNIHTTQIMALLPSLQSKLTWKNWKQ